jgi:hypothetical protein
MLALQRYEQSTPPPVAIPFQSPRLCYFISRSNGNIVPLIPADELPYSVKLIGVPRVMKMEHTCGMSHVGTLPFTGQYFKLEPDSMQHPIERTETRHRNTSASNFKQRFATPNTVPRDEQVKPDTVILPKTGPTTSQQLPVSAATATWRKTNDAASARSQVIIDAIVASDSRSPTRTPQMSIRVSRTPTSPPGSPSEPGDKVYCTHWIRHGECDYIQQGCRYKHEMPDKITLASIGFRTVPRWWQEKVAVQLGQSAVPTVGPVMKPSEWLKQRRGSLDSQSSEESVCRSESGGEEELGAAAVPTKASVTQHSTRTSTPVSQRDKKATAMQSKHVTQRPNKTTSQAPVVAAAKSIAMFNPYLPEGDLIDLIDLTPTSPTTPTPRASATTTTSLTNTSKPTAATPPASPTPDSLSKRATNPPRKIFVPAGESPEYHLAEAHKHAQVQVAKPPSPIIKAAELQKPLVKRSDTSAKRGLAASIHAPQATKSPRSRSPKAVQPQCLPSLSTRKVVIVPAKASAAVSVPRESKPRKLAVWKAEAVVVKDKALKVRHHKQSAPSFCRPRRPTVCGPKTVVSSRSTTEVHEVK